MEPRSNSVEHRSFKKRIDEFCRQLNLDGEFDWPPAVDRECWDEYDCTPSNKGIAMCSSKIRINTLAKRPISRAEHKNKAVAPNHKFCAVIILKNKIKNKHVHTGASASAGT